MKTLWWRVFSAKFLVNELFVLEGISKENLFHKVHMAAYADKLTKVGQGEKLNAMFISRARTVLGK